MLMIPGDDPPDVAADDPEDEPDDDPEDDDEEEDDDADGLRAASFLVLFACALGVWQATHSAALELFITRHVWHSHVLAFGLNAIPKPDPLDARLLAISGKLLTFGAAVLRGVSQAMHLLASALLDSIQASHSQADEDFLKRSPKPPPSGTIAVVIGAAWTGAA